MLLGKNKLDITPERPVFLAGFAHRKQRTIRIERNLYVKTFVIQKDTRDILFIIADLIWWDEEFVRDLLDIIAVEYSIPSEQVCFHATHNHSGPQTTSKFSKQLGELSKNYLLYLKNRVLTSIEIAMNDMEEVSMKIGKGTSELGVYRRKKEDGKIEMKPNTNIQVDNDLTVTSFINTNNKMKAVWIHYSCHPTTTDANIISTEFVGVCCENIEEYYSNATVAFLQGFCGDVRPNLVKEDEFYRGQIKDMKKIGNLFTSDVIEVMKESEVASLKGATVCKKQEVSLIFNNDNLSRFVPESLAHEWPTMVKNNLIKGYTLIFQYIHLSKDISFLTCNAELVQAYGFYVKEINNNLLPLGYSNGMIGYIPTAEQLMEGGYESFDSAFYFGYPSIVDKDMEDEIKQTFKTILGGNRNESNFRREKR